MTKPELIYEVAKNCGLTKVDAKQIVSAVLYFIGHELARGNKVQIGGFGTFDVRHRNARKGRNPRTDETIDLPESNLVHFTASSILKRAIN